MFLESSGGMPFSVYNISNSQKLPQCLLAPVPSQRDSSTTRPNDSSLRVDIGLLQLQLLNLASEVGSVVEL